MSALVTVKMPWPNGAYQDYQPRTTGFLIKENDKWKVNHTLKKKPLRFEDLQDFIACYHPANRLKRQETWNERSNPEGRWRKFGFDQIVARDKTSLDIFWLKDKSLADLDNLPEPDELAGEIIDNLEAGMNSFRAVAAAL